MKIKSFIFLLTLVVFISLIHGAGAQTLTVLKTFSEDDFGGEYPQAPLIQGPDGVLYGTTFAGGPAGPYGLGVVFKMNPNGGDYVVLHSFGGGAEGGEPFAPLLLSEKTLYGTTLWGGSSGQGTIFKIDTDGSNFTTLHSFANGFDGGEPFAGLVLCGTNLYGTTTTGGEWGNGTIYRISTNGSCFTTLHSFKYTVDGSTPFSDLLLSGNTLYGTTYRGGSVNARWGTVFKLNTDGSGFSTLHVFDFNTEGGNPYSGLVLSGNLLYGAAASGGDYVSGTVFKIDTNGASFATVHCFNGETDGAIPQGRLILSGGALYGTTILGGDFDWGTVFRVNTNGDNFETLFSFADGLDGSSVESGAMKSGATLYGTAQGGGALGYGTIFALSLAIPLNLTFKDGNLELNWNDPDVLLQSAPAAGGPYTSISGAASPYTSSITNAQQYFRLWGR